MPMPSWTNRFEEKVARASGCWEWQASKTHDGYGLFRLPGRHGKKRYAHRLAYELYVGPIPEGLELDHLCRNTSCVNPEHLEPVTHQENTFRGDFPNRRKTHCKHGHPFDERNTRLERNGRKRVCRRCGADRQLRRKARIRETTTQ